MHEASAPRALADALGNPPDGGILVFRLWHYPPDDAWASWALFETLRRDGLLREARWDRHGGLSRRERSLTEEELRTFRMPAEYVAINPLDATAQPLPAEFGIQGKAVLQWGRPVPATLRSVAAWHSRTRARFLARLDARC